MNTEKNIASATVSKKTLLCGVHLHVSKETIIQKCTKLLKTLGIVCLVLKLNFVLEIRQKLADSKVIYLSSITTNIAADLVKCVKRHVQKHPFVSVVLSVGHFTNSVVH